MSETVSLSEAEQHLSELVDRAAAGEEIVIEQEGKPRAKLVPYPVLRVERKPGMLKGQIWISDDFDDPLPPEIQDAFEGKLP